MHGDVCIEAGRHRSSLEDVPLVLSGPGPDIRRKKMRQFSRVSRSEEKIPLMGLAVRLAVPPETYLLGIVGAEFMTKELAVGGSPRLRFAIHDR